MYTSLPPDDHPYTPDSAEAAWDIYYATLFAPGYLHGHLLEATERMAAVLVRRPVDSSTETEDAG